MTPARISSDLRHEQNRRQFLAQRRDRLIAQLDETERALAEGGERIREQRQRWSDATSTGNAG